MEDIDIIKCYGKHLPCVLLLDKSGSMAGEPIDTLNQGILQFYMIFFKECCGDMTIADLCIISFGGKGSDGGEPDIEILQEFAPVPMYFKPLIANETAKETTPLAEAVETGLNKIAGIKKVYRCNDIDYYKPRLICITDGESTEDEAYYNSVKDSLKEAVDNNRLSVFAFGIGDRCNYKKLYEFFGEKNTYRFEDCMSRNDDPIIDRFPE